jgi:hypothetical protein
MSYAKYAEDIDDEREERKLNKNIYSSQYEAAEINKRIQSAEGMENYHRLQNSNLQISEIADTIKYLKLKRNSLQFRENLARAISSTVSPITSFVLRAYVNQMKSSLKLINDRLDRYSRYDIVAVEEEDRRSIKNTFVAQLIMNLLNALNTNADVQESNRMLIQDIDSLIYWYYSDTLIGGFSSKFACDQKMKSEFYYKELCFDIIKCETCGSDTIKNCNKCISCGRVR